MVLLQLSHSEEVTENIRNALAQGMEVTISQGQITSSGWTGAGYIIIDPNKGAGAYLIEGGINGGWITAESILMLVLLLVLFFAFVLPVLWLPLIVASMYASLATATVIALLESVILIAVLLFELGALTGSCVNILTNLCNLYINLLWFLDTIL